MCAGDREGSPDRVRSPCQMFPKNRRNSAQHPTAPAIRHRNPSGVTPTDREMACRVEPPGASHACALRYVRNLIRGDIRIGAWRHRKYPHVPSKFRQVIREPERPLETAAAAHRREMERDQYHPFSIPHIQTDTLKGEILGMEGSSTVTASDDAFYDYYSSESVSEATAQRFASTKAAVMRVARHFDLPDQPLAVADIGCGAGSQCMLWAQDGHKVFGIDINSRLIELGRQRAQAASLNIDLRAGSATSLPWSDASMDICLSPELLEHVADWRTCLKEAARVLRPGGILYLSTTNKLCPVQQEFTLPLYSWYPKFLKRKYERLAITTRPEIANHAKFPAVNWFTFYGLRSTLARDGFESLDRFDVAALADRSLMPRLVLNAATRLPPLRLLGHLLTPHTTMFARKGLGQPAERI